MIIALDYDNTVTADPVLFLQFAASATRRGHQVYIVTMRYPSEVLYLPDAWDPVLAGVVFTSRRAKRSSFRSQMNGVEPDVWIDDRPETVSMGAAEAFGRPAFPEGQTAMCDDHTWSGNGECPDCAKAFPPTRASSTQGTPMVTTADPDQAHVAHDSAIRKILELVHKYAKANEESDMAVHMLTALEEDVKKLL